MIDQYDSDSDFEVKRDENGKQGFIEDERVMYGCASMLH